MIKHWQVNDISTEKSRILSETYGLSPLVCDILVGRGLDTPLAVEDFLDENGALWNPFDLIDMEAAVQRIQEAIENEEKIAVYGDYDCDGVTATAILYQYFSSIGGDVVYYIPERDGEGYGLNATAIELLAKQGVKLLVTVDNGITALQEVLFAKTLEMDVVITDHHQPGEELPDAIAVVNPHRRDCESEYKYLCGAGVALKLVAAFEDGNMDSAVEYFGDLATIGTIGDIVPLTGENRTMVKRGLRMIQNSENIGLKALLEIAGLSDKSLTAENIAFGLVPRINAAGRMGSANLAMELLLCEEEEYAMELARQIDLLNRQRQQQEAEIMEDIEQILQEHPEKLRQRVLVLSGENWPHGVIGIVSARVLERFSKPNILISREGEEARGSARSCGEFSLFKALSACSGYLTKFGGHKLAAGLSLHTSELESFEEAVNNYAKETCDEMPQTSCQIDRLITLEELTIENIDSLEALQPFGAENQSPLFLLKNLKISEIKPLSENKHLKITCCDSNQHTVQVLCFGVGRERFLYEQNDMVDLVVSVGINEYHGKRSVSVKMKDIRPSGFDEARFFSAKSVYEKIFRDEPVDSRLKSRIFPKREELAAIYKLLRNNGGFWGTAEDLYLKIRNSGLNYCKFRFILDVLNELELIFLSESGKGIQMPQEERKTNLNQSKLLHKLSQL